MSEKNRFGACHEPHLGKFQELLILTLSVFMSILVRREPLTVKINK